jgi:trigger factor
MARLVGPALRIRDTLMEVVEKTAEGLSRSYGVTVPAAELGAALDTRIAEILPTLKLKGFRPGKVPQAHVRRLYGKALMSEVVEKTLNDTSQQVLNDTQLRIASRPELKPISDMEQVIAGREDLAYDIEVEVMPDFEPIDVSTLSLERIVYHSSDEELETALAEVVAQNRTFEAREEGEAAQDGDQLVVDFVGRIDGEAFDGGSATDAEIVLGSGQFIPGFEEQLVGAKGGDAVTVNVSFPDEYQAEHLKGKAAAFEVTVKEVRAPKEAEASDALAERLGMADLDALKTALRENLDRQYVSASRFKLKRALLDALDTAHDIPLPPRMVQAEFDGIWQQVEKDRTEGEVSPEDAGKSEEELQAEYRKIAERRVRLGLVLAEIGRREGVNVTDAELGDAMRAEATRYGAQAQEIFDLLRRNPDIQAQMRAPLYEEKVVDFIVGRASVTDREVPKDELLREDDLPEGYGASEPDAEATPEAAAESAGEAEAGEAEAHAPKKRRAAKPKAGPDAEQPAAEAAAEPAEDEPPKAEPPEAEAPEAEPGVDQD